MSVRSKQSSSSRRHPSQPNAHRPHSASQHSQVGGPGSSPPSARETFLNYFFGQNGPGPIAGSSLDRSNSQMHAGGGGPGGGGGQNIVPVGRDVSGGDSSRSSGIMAGKMGMDGNNAAFDMKSLGRHIEAVSFCSSELIDIF